MRHIFRCVECGTDFEKVDASVLCEACRNKPPNVEPVAVVEEPEITVESEPLAQDEPIKKPKKFKKSAGGE